MRTLLAALLGLGALTACATTASQKTLIAEQAARAQGRDPESIARRNAENAVVLTANPDQVKGCKSLGLVEDWQARDGLKAAAVKRGGDVVLIVNSPTHATREPHHGGTVDVANGPAGEIYACAGVR